MSKNIYILYDLTSLHGTITHYYHFFYGVLVPLILDYMELIKTHDHVTVLIKNDLGPMNTEAVREGCVNVERHIQNLKKFGVNPIVSINHFIHDTDEEIAIVKEFCDRENVPLVISKHWAEGGDGAESLANAVKAELDSEKTEIQLIYNDDDSLLTKVEKVATEIYRAKAVTISAAASTSFKQIEKMGWSFANLYSKDSIKLFYGSKTAWGNI